MNQTSEGDSGDGGRTDIFSAAKRSDIMSRVRRKNTEPELRARSLLHRLGFRFRLHRDDLPGTPDIVLQKHKTVIFVHGCFWHRHEGCSSASMPRQNTEYWKTKFERNVRRDSNNVRELKNGGWRVLILWECELRGEMSEAKEKLNAFF